jgi:hypothetical protein
VAFLEIGREKIPQNGWELNPRSQAMASARSVQKNIILIWIFMMIMQLNNSIPMAEYFKGKKIFDIKTKQNLILL